MSRYDNMIYILFTPSNYLHNINSNKGRQTKVTPKFHAETCNKVLTSWGCRPASACSLLQLLLIVSGAETEVQEEEEEEEEEGERWRKKERKKKKRQQDSVLSVKENPWTVPWARSHLQLEYSLSPNQWFVKAVKLFLPEIFKIPIIKTVKKK